MSAAGNNKAAEETLKASREAGAFFERFDKSNLYHAAAQRNTDWLLGEDTPNSGTGPLCGLSSNNSFTFLVPQKSSKPLYRQELHRIVRELVEGIYVFNQLPGISIQPNYDGSSVCLLPSAYHDTLVGNILVTVDYHMKSLLHGTTISQKDKRSKLTEEWRKIPSTKLREEFTESGMTEMQKDEELGKQLYSKLKEKFIRYPPRCVCADLALRDLTPRLTTGEQCTQHEDHVSRDMFVRYLDHVSMNLVFRQRTLQQEGSTVLLNPDLDITTNVLATLAENNKELYAHLHYYLQKQRKFVAKNLHKKKEIAHYLDLLNFISFMVLFLVTLKRQNKIVDVKQLTGTAEQLHTERELPPVLASENSLWSTYTGENSHSTLHGGIEFHVMEQSIAKAAADFIQLLEQFQSTSDLSVLQSKEGGQYHVLTLTVEPYYSKSPKLPRWLHGMTSELHSQCSRLPALSDARVQDLLKKSCGPRSAADMTTVNVLLQACIEKGLLAGVWALLKRCTQTRLVKPDEHGMTMLHYAAINAKASIQSVLILAGSNVLQPFFRGDSATKTQPIHFAAQSGGLESLCCLLRYGADTRALDDDGWAPVHYAAFHNYQSQVLHLASIDPDSIAMETGDKHRSTPLLLAAQNGGFDTVKRLIELGADLKSVDSFSRNVVHIAALNHHIDILKYLIDLDDPSCNVWMILSAMLASDLSSGYPEAAARCMDTLMQWKPKHCHHLLKYSAVPSLVQLLKQEEKLQLLSIQVLANLSDNSGISSTLGQPDTITTIVKLLSSASDRIHANACIVLSDLAVHSDNQVAIAKAGAIPLLLKLLRSSSDDVQLYSCACIGILCYDNPTNQTAVNEASGLPVLVSLLESALPCTQCCAASTLQFALEGNRGNQLSTLDATIIPPLVVLLRSKDVPVHSSAARAVEALAENCEEAQQELLGNTTCINLLKRLLKMRDPEVKVCGGCALWAIAGRLISNKRLIATHMGLVLLVDMLTVHNEKLDFVCSEALGALASELGDNQKRIESAGGIKPLVEVLTLQTSQRVCLSVINTLAALTMKPALMPSPQLQRSIATARGITLLASVVNSQTAEIVKVEAACTLAKLVLNNPENDRYLQRRTDFSYLTVFKFFTSTDPKVRLLAGYCLALLAFNNSTKLEQMILHGSLHISNFIPFLESKREFYQAHAAFQIVVLSKLLSGVSDIHAVVRGINILVALSSSDVEATKVLSAEFIASLAHMKGGLCKVIVMAGALEPLLNNLRMGNGPVIESSSVALGYLTFDPTAARTITGEFRDNPELYETFREQIDTVVVSKKFLANWKHLQSIGLPSLSLEVKGGPSVQQGWRTAAARTKRTGTRPVLTFTSTVTSFTENKSTVHPASSHTLSRLPPSECSRAVGFGLLAKRKAALSHQSVRFGQRKAPLSHQPGTKLKPILH